MTSWQLSLLIRFMRIVLSYIGGYGYNREEIMQLQDSLKDENEKILNIKL